MPTLITTRPLRYNAREMVAGEEFPASARDARVLVALRRATIKAPERGASMVSKSEKVESSPPPEPAIRTKRQYRRRDMVADDSAAIDPSPENTEGSIAAEPAVDPAVELPQQDEAPRRVTSSDY